MAGAKSQGVGQGPAKGTGNGSAAHKLDTSPEKQRERVNSGWMKRKMRAYAEAHPESSATERAPSRVEIAESARGKMHDALEKLEQVIHTSRSDMAVVQAFTALKDLAYGKDPQAIDIKFEFEGMSEAELRDAIAAELGIVTIEHHPESGSTARGIAAPEADEIPA